MLQEKLLLQSRISQARSKLFLLNEEMAQILLGFSDAMRNAAFNSRLNKGKVNLEFICEKMLTLADLQGEIRATEQQITFLESF